MDLVSFYILRTSTDDTQTRNPERELSLIPFPMEEIFDTKLHTFDVVVFQNFGYAEPALSIASYERNLEQYVSGGGALLVIGGDHAFGEGRAAYPVLDRALPVDPERDAGAWSSRSRSSSPPDGLRHPVMRGPDHRERDPVLVGRAPAGERAERRPGEAGRDGAARPPDPAGQRAARAGARALGPRARPGHGDDDRRQLDLGLHRAADRRAEPALRPVLDQRAPLAGARSGPHLAPDHRGSAHGRAGPLGGRGGHRTAAGLPGRGARPRCGWTSSRWPSARCCQRASRAPGRTAWRG